MIWCSLYVEEMYEAWKADPSSVHKSWDVYFRNSDAGKGGAEAFAAPPRVLEVCTSVCVCVCVCVCIYAWKYLSSFLRGFVFARRGTLKLFGSHRVAIFVFLKFLWEQPPYPTL